MNSRGYCTQEGLEAQKSCTSGAKNQIYKFTRGLYNFTNPQNVHVRVHTFVSAINKLNDFGHKDFYFLTSFYITTAYRL